MNCFHLGRTYHTRLGKPGGSFPIRLRELLVSHPKTCGLKFGRYAHHLHGQVKASTSISSGGAPPPSGRPFNQYYSGEGPSTPSTSVWSLFVEAMKIIASAYLAWLGLIWVCTAAREDYMNYATPKIPGSETWKLSIIIPALNEEKMIASTISWLRNNLEDGQSIQIIVVDGGSGDRTIAEAKRAGADKVITSSPGRGRQMNAGAQAATGQILVFLHADTLPPSDLVSSLRTELSSPRTVLVGHHTQITDSRGQVMGLMTAHNCHKTWFYPWVIEPLSYLAGLRLMFGDQVLCCRRQDFMQCGGYPEHAPIMEDGDLCRALHRQGPATCFNHLYKGPGRINQLDSKSITSGRRLEAWSAVQATYIHFRIAVAWYQGASGPELKDLYYSLYTDKFR